MHIKGNFEYLDYDYVLCRYACKVIRTSGRAASLIEPWHCSPKITNNDLIESSWHLFYTKHHNSYFFACPPSDVSNTFDFVTIRQQYVFDYNFILIVISLKIVKNSIFLNFSI